MFDFSLNNWAYYVYLAAGIVVSVTLHEWTKSFVSHKLGDVTAKNNSGLSLNPLKRLDPLGFIVMLFFRYGWGNPAHTSPVYYKNKKRGIVLAYTIPTLVNLFLGVLLINAAQAILFKAGGLESGAAGPAFDLTAAVAMCNIRLALINLIPVYPMDGSRVLSAFLSPRGVVKMANYEKILQAGLVLFIVLGLAENLFRPVYYLITKMVLPIWS